MYLSDLTAKGDKTTVAFCVFSYFSETATTLLHSNLFSDGVLLRRVRDRD